MKTTRIFLCLGIFFLALFLRLYQLGQVPYGFHVDEAKAAWNAYSILKTSHDDHGNFLPLYYDSFGDFRPAGIIYAIIPSILIFGNTVFATRFPSAFFGALSIFPLMLIFWQISRDKDKKWYWIPGLFLAINPWHIMVSRATSEVVITIFFGLFALYFFLKAIHQKSSSSIIYCLIFTLVSYLFYHTNRILMPIFLVAITFFYWSEIKTRQNFKSTLIIIFGSLFFTFIFFCAPEARGRFSQVSILSDPKIRLETVNMPNQEGPGHVLIARIFHNRPLVVLKDVVSEYSNYFSTNFLVGDSALPLRYRTQNFGLITYIELLFLVLSLAAAGTKKEVWLPLLLLLISPLPAAITNEDTPNLHRALFMVPFIVLLESYGVIFLLSLKKYSRLLFFLSFSALLFNLIYFWHFYTNHQKFGLPSYFRNSGAVEIAAKIFQLKNQYSQIILTNSPDELYPWFAFLNKIDPVSFNQSAINRNHGFWTWQNIVFSADKCPSEKISNSIDINSDKILIVDAEGCQIDPKLAKKQNIKYLDGIRRPDLSQPYLLLQKN
jgi:hypothetical protein